MVFEVCKGYKMGFHLISIMKKNFQGLNKCCYKAQDSGKLQLVSIRSDRFRKLQEEWGGG